MLPAYRIPLLTMLATVMGLAAGELVLGTHAFFAAMMAVTLTCIGLTYNVLGGLSTLSGITFAVCTLRWVVISQFAKVILGQPADSNLVDPSLTATVYAVFFGCLLPGSFFYARMRLKLPKPAEPETTAQSGLFYAIALAGGLTGEVLFNLYTVTYGKGEQNETQLNGYHSAGVALQALLLLALVIAVDSRLRKTGGRHSFGTAAFVPWMAGMLGGFINTERAEMLAPTLLYFATCYFRGYRFRLRHYVACVSGILLFIVFISPLELFSRDAVRDLEFRDRVYAAFHLLATVDWAEVRAASERESAAGGASYEDYYGVSGVDVLNRVSRIRMDSNLIAACANYHYGFTTINNDLLSAVPHFLLKQKPQRSSADFVGRVSGVSGDIVGNTEPAFTMVSDSFGAFGWLGVIVTSLIILPVVFMVYESMFDMSRPWGTVALVTCAQGFPESGLSGLIAYFLLRLPIYLLLASYAVHLAAKWVPMQGDDGQPLSDDSPGHAAATSA